MLTATIVATAIFFGVWIACYTALPNERFHMDPHGVPGGFEEHLKRYQSMAQLVITLATASVAYLLNFLLGIKKGDVLSEYALALRNACPFAITLFGFSITMSFAFIAFESLSYETYSHRRDPDASTYTRGQYATNLAFGYSCVVSFVVACGIVAFAVLQTH